MCIAVQKQNVLLVNVYSAHVHVNAAHAQSGGTKVCCKVRYSYIGPLSERYLYRFVGQCRIVQYVVVLSIDIRVM